MPSSVGPLFGNFGRLLRGSMKPTSGNQQRSLAAGVDGGAMLLVGAAASASMAGIVQG